MEQGPLAALYAPGLLAFWLVLMNPGNGLADSSHPAPFLTAALLFVAFGLGSLAFWAWFRFRPAEPPGPAPSEPPPAPGAAAAA